MLAPNNGLNCSLLLFPPLPNKAQQHASGKHVLIINKPTPCSSVLPHTLESKRFAHPTYTPSFVRQCISPWLLRHSLKLPPPLKLPILSFNKVTRASLRCTAHDASCLRPILTPSPPPALPPTHLLPPLYELCPLYCVPAAPVQDPQNCVFLSPCHGTKPCVTQTPLHGLRMMHSCQVVALWG